MKSLYYLTKLSAKSSSYENDIKEEKTIVMWIEDKPQKRVPVDENSSR